jgi:hypothetical protein
VIDAAGLLTVSQKVLPLETDFSVFGTARVTDATRVSVSALRLGAADAARRDVTEAFAPGAHRKLSDQERLSAPAFEQRPAGVQSLSGDGLAADRVLAHPVAYETLVSDSAAEPVRMVAGGPAEPVRVVGGGPTGEQFEALAPGGAAGSSPQSRARARARAMRTGLDRVGYPQDLYGVTRIGDVAPLDAGGAVADRAAAGVLVSLTDAQARREALIAAGVATDLQILPEAQLAA